MIILMVNQPSPPRLYKEIFSSMSSFLTHASSNTRVTSRVMVLFPDGEGHELCYSTSAELAPLAAVSGHFERVDLVGVEDGVAFFMTRLQLPLPTCLRSQLTPASLADALTQFTSTNHCLRA